MNLLTNLSELPVGNKESTQGLQALNSVAAILFGGLLVDGSIRSLRFHGAQTLSLPDELLKQVAIILGEDQFAGLVDDFAKIPDQLLTFFREVLGGRGEGLGLEGAVQGDVALLVRGQLAMFES